MSTDAPAAPPTVPATVLSLAARQLAALGDPGRLQVLAAVLRRGGSAGSTLHELAADQGLDLRDVVRCTGSLEAAGLVRVEGHRVHSAHGVLAGTAEALTAAVPVVRLLAAEPDLARFFSYGRLSRLPAMNRLEERARLAALLVQVLPPGRSLTEPEVNAALQEVGDDHAALRRFLVEEGRLTRGAGRDYRRVDQPPQRG